MIFQNTECFYYCEPILGHFQVPDNPAEIYRVPVCADYCNYWFEACKNDMTCVEHWLEDFEIDEYFANSCPRDSPCRTIKEEYGNGEGLCNQLLRNGLFYSTATVL